MAHLCSVYPFHADAWFGERGVLMGANVTGGMGGFYFDPFEFYAQRHLTNPNMIVMGSVGFGKSATVKALVRRLKAVYGAGRYLAIIDPKGEYSSRRRTTSGSPSCAFTPAAPIGSTRWTPEAATTTEASSPARTSPRNSSPVCSAASSLRSRTPCSGGRSNAAVRPGAPSRSATCAPRSLDPPDELVRLSRHSPLELARATAPVTFALDKLCTRTLRGMFDGPTTVSIDWDNGPGVVLDLSAVYGNSEALPLVMVAATHWLTGALRGRPERRSVQVIDEAWAAVRHGAAYFQSSLKLSRTYGVATVLVCHRPSDLTAQADDGTAVGEDRRRAAVRHPDPRAAAPTTRAGRRSCRDVRPHRT